MANLDINRSVHFVSLDTHPANNALVVTYEILVTVTNQETQRELSRRSKRDQMQINISALDKLSEEELRADKLMINLHDLSAKILNECPLLNSYEHKTNTEDIQLHLLYLAGRRRSQLLAAQVSSAAGNTRAERPPSSASIGGRLRGPPGSRPPSSGGKWKLGTPRAKIQSAAGAEDIYSYLYAREQVKANNIGSDNHVFMCQFAEHLSSIETANELLVANDSDDDEIFAANCDIDALLEGLYGDLREKRQSMAYLRRLSGQDEGLARMSSNRLLVCAMLRTLRDSESEAGSGDLHLRESIFYCLIRFTEFADVYSRTFAAATVGGQQQQAPIDLLRTVADLFVHQVKGLVLAAGQQQQQQQQHQARHYYLSSLVITLANLLKFDDGLQQLKRLLCQPAPEGSQQQHRSLAVSLGELLQLASQQLARDVRLLSEPSKSLSLLQRLVSLFLHLSIYKEFLMQLRSHSKQFADTLVGLLATLQLSGRPGSSATTADDGQRSSSATVTDRQTLNEFYVLEIELMRLICNVMMDQRIRAKLIKRNLLKCVLRNLVLFLASSRNQEASSNTLAPFQRSSVLMVPFKCLYELTCSNQITSELYKSKIIIKCLLEYLLSATMDLRLALELRQALGGGGRDSEAASMRKRQQLDELDEQIVLEPDQASHYILSLWANLSSRPEAPIYKLATLAELGSLVGEYIELASCNLGSFLRQQQQQLLAGTRDNFQRPASSPGTNRRADEKQDLIIYLHAKLLRNLSQHLDLTPSPDLGSLDAATLNSYTKWLQRFAELCNDLVAMMSPHQQSSNLLVPLTVECLATLNNLVAKGGQQQLDENTEESLLATIPLPPLGPLIERLLSLNRACNDLDADNDDLLLVSIIFLGTLARHKEICGEIGSIGLALIRASNYILESRGTDHEMVVSCLHALSQLMNHSGFLMQLARLFDEPTSTTGAVQRLLEMLAELVLHPDVMVARLAILLLNRLRRLEEQRSMESVVVHEQRFVGFNGKWLQAIKVSREQLIAGAPISSPKNGEQVYDTENDNDDEQLRALGHEAGSSSAGSSTTAISQRISRLDEDDEDELDEDEYDEENEEDSNLEHAPDLNVIDANSMIKHLTSRREFRSEWLGRR